jgi:hypothetical protein
MRTRLWSHRRRIEAMERSRVVSPPAERIETEGAGAQV